LLWLIPEDQNSSGSGSGGLFHPPVGSRGGSGGPEDPGGPLGGSDDPGGSVAPGRPEDLGGSLGGSGGPDGPVGAFHLRGGKFKEPVGLDVPEGADDLCEYWLREFVNLGDSRQSDWEL